MYKTLYVIVLFVLGISFPESAGAQDSPEEIDRQIAFHQGQGDRVSMIFWLEKKLNRAESLSAEEHFDTRLLLARSKQAAGYLNEALTICESLLPEAEREEKAMLLNDLANISSDLKDYDQAETYYRQASKLILEISGKVSLPYGQSLTNSGLLALARKDYALAERYLKESLKIKGSFEQVPARSYVKTLNGMGMVYQAKKSYGAALKYFTDAQKIIQDVYGKTHPDYSIITGNIAGLYHLMKRYDFAAKNYLEMLEAKSTEISILVPAMSEQEKLTYLRLNKRYLNNFFSLCADVSEKGLLKQNKALLKTACDLAIGSKGIILESLISIRSYIRDDKEARAEFEDLQEKTVRLALLFNRGEGRSAEFQKLRKEAETLEKKLYKRIPEAQGSQSISLFHETDTVRQELKPGEAALEIIRFRRMKDNENYETAYAAFVIRPNKPEPDFIVLPAGDEFENKYFASYDFNVTQNINGKDKISYDIFWKPIEAALEGVNRLYISTDGIYRKMAAETFFDTEKNEFLFDRYEFHYMNNLRALSRPDYETLQRNYAVLFGVSEFNNLKFKDKEQREYFESVFSSSLNSLPGVRKEVDSLEKILLRAGKEVKNYIDKNATEHNFKTLMKPQILHIATHGYFLKTEDNNPLLRSGLLLSSDSLYEGLLTALEVTGTDLRGTELVVLSACETGGGKIINGEGVYGLQRAFFTAGAKKLIMSLWKVDDLATQKLMNYFYRYYIEEKRSAEQAFRDARSALREEFEDPYYWGAFILIKN